MRGHSQTSDGARPDRNWRWALAPELSEPAPCRERVPPRLRPRPVTHGSERRARGAGTAQIGGTWLITHEHNSTPFYMDGSDKAALDLHP